MIGAIPHFHGVTLFLVCFLAGGISAAVNTVAGGGSLISYPILTAGVGLSTKIGNATNSVGLWPGSMSGALAFLDMWQLTWIKLKPLILPTIIGSQIGAILLLITPVRAFDVIVPFLILFAVGLLAFQQQIKNLAASGKFHVSKLAGWWIQFAVSIYGGYFGAGMGIMMLAAFSLYVDGTIHDHNAVKNWLGMLINFSITFTFLWQHLVVGAVAIPMILGAIIGGYWAGKFSQKVDSDVLRKYIVGYGLLSAIYFFVAVIKK